MTWLEFKQKVEAEEVTDDMEIQYIDISCVGGGESIEVETISDGKAKITN